MHHNENNEKSSGGFWSFANVLISIVLAAFALSTGAAFIYQGWKHSRYHGEDRLQITAEDIAARYPGADAPAKDAPAAAPADATAPAALAASGEGDVKVQVLKPGTDNPMSFDVKEIKVKAGQKIELTFDNKSNAPMQHNLIVGAKDSGAKLVEKANAMMTDMPTWMGKGFVPEGPEVLHATKLLNPGESQTLKFEAPKEPGIYPYLCTFPGHAAIMQGKIIVE